MRKAGDKKETSPAVRWRVNTTAVGGSGAGKFPADSASRDTERDNENQQTIQEGILIWASGALNFNFSLMSSGAATAPDGAAIIHFK